MGKVVTIVSGLPRTGTSLMMKMLEAGGMEVVVDNIRKADEDNPGGYYEFEKVKEIKEDKSWLEQAGGKVFKMVSMLLYDLPADFTYKVVFMEREMGEMLASQRKMLERKGQDTGAENDAENKRLYEKHLTEIKDWLKGRANINVLYINYNETMADPHKSADAVNGFLGGGLDVGRMAGVLDKSLYRNKSAAVSGEAGGEELDKDSEDEMIKAKLSSLGYM